MLWTLKYLDDETIEVTYVSKDEESQVCTATARCVLGADGARSKVARQGVPKYADIPWVLAYHEIVEAPSAATEDYDPERCEVWYQGKLSPDFYAWVFLMEILLASASVAQSRISRQKTLSQSYGLYLAWMARPRSEKKAPPFQ